MPRKSILPQSRHHIMVYDEDWEYLQKKFGDKLPPGVASRNILHFYISGLKAKTQQMIDEKGEGGE